MSSWTICVICALLHVAAVATRIHEPSCTTFDYNEKLLEKLVRMEHKMELLEDTVKNALLSKLDALENSISNLEKLTNEKLAKERVDRIAELADLESDIQNQIKDVVIKGRLISFMAQLSTNMDNPSAGTLVKFDNVITNEGHAYDASQGTFTAPIDGVYNFNLVASAPNHHGPQHVLHLYIMKNSDQIGYIFLDRNQQYWLRRSTDINVRLVAEDRVWVKIGYAVDPNTLAGCCFHTHFSGFLIGAL